MKFFFFCIWISKYCVSPRRSWCRFGLLAKTRQTWKLDGMNSVEYELLSRDYLPLYTNITVNIGTKDGLRPLTPNPESKERAENRPGHWHASFSHSHIHARTIQGLSGVCGLGAEPLQCINQVINSSPPVNTVTVLRTSLHVLVWPRGRDSHHCCLKHKSALHSLSPSLPSSYGFLLTKLPGFRTPAPRPRGSWVTGHGTSWLVKALVLQWRRRTWCYFTRLVL